MSHKTHVLFSLCILCKDLLEVLRFGWIDWHSKMKGLRYLTPDICIQSKFKNCNVKIKD
jgi:hypothetical protein